MGIHSLRGLTAVLTCRQPKDYIISACVYITKTFILRTRNTPTSNNIPSSMSTVSPTSVKTYEASFEESQHRPLPPFRWQVSFKSLKNGLKFSYNSSPIELLPPSIDGDYAPLQGHIGP